MSRRKAERERRYEWRVQEKGGQRRRLEERNGE